MSLQQRFGFLKEKRFLLFLLLFALIFVRYCYYGFEYYHQLDDYIQYHNYAQGGNLFGKIMGLGLLAARPLAGCADVLVWSRFFDVMLLAVAVISAMYAASACLLQLVWSRHFGTGYVFLAAFTLLPLGIEGTYWVSASSRVVVGLFFASLALYFFERWCSEGKRRTLILYALAQLISYGFYEQALVFSLTSVFIVAALHFKENKNRALWGLVSILNAAVYFVFTGLFKNSAVYGNRMGIITSYGRYYWNTTFPYIKNQIKDAFVKGGFYTLVKGAYRGAQMLAADGVFLYSAIITVLCGILSIFTSRRESNEVKKPVTAIITGLLLALAPVTIFFALESAWFSLRCTVMSFCGIALIADTLISLVTARLKRGRILTALLVGSFALLCCVASVSEMHDYRATTGNDRMIIDLITERLTADGRMKPELKVAVLNVESSYLPNQNYFFHEHLHGVTESAWALTGALECRVGPGRASVTPMPKSPAYQPWNKEASKLSGFDAVYIYLDGAVFEVKAVKMRGNDYDIIDGERHRIGRVWEENNYGYLELYDGGRGYVFD